eukprot:scaffold83976_cov61-Phaeocystis_antarctica.AAC.1
MVLWHAHRSAKANRAGSAGSVTHPPPARVGGCERMRPELAGAQIDEDCPPAICDCGPDYFVKVPLRRSSECCGYTFYERASSSAEYQSSVGVDLVMCACLTQYTGCCCCCELSTTNGGRDGQFRGLTPVSKLEERRVGADGDGMPSSAASPRDHRQRPQARPGRARAPARGAVEAGRSAERRAPESELVPVCHELRSSRTRWHTGAGLG